MPGIPLFMTTRDIGASLAPSISGSNYPVVPKAGGDKLTLTGLNFTAGVGAPTATYDGAPATVDSYTSTTVTIITTSTTAGSKAITVTTSHGTSSAFMVEAFDLYAIVASLLYIAPYTGSPFAPHASGGSSGSAGNLTESTNPPAVGTAINGLTPPDFDGVDDRLTHASNWSSFINTAEGTILALAIVDTFAANNATASNNEAILAAASSLTGVGMCVSDAGLRAYINDGALKSPTPIASTAITAGVASLLHLRWDGTNVKQGVNNGTEGTTAAGAISSGALAGAIRVGRSIAGTQFFDGKLLALIVLQTELTQVTIGKIYSCLRCIFQLP